MKKKIFKFFLLVVEFGICFAAAMAFCYDYLYPYPMGILDVEEREANARYYKIVYKEKLDKNTTLYFSRSNNGVGSDVHFGTIDSSLPQFIANFKAESTSSVYIPANTISYTTATDGTCYLFGVTTDENTVNIDITFYKSDTETMTYEMKFEDQCFYYQGFDKQWASYDCTITGYNVNGEATFEYYGSPFMENVAAEIEND